MGGLIARLDYSTILSKTEYSLTALGQTLRPVMAAIAADMDSGDDGLPW